jgi:endonuclease/exonuclease/phosphatase (EEP) superfamily protein YafD
VARRYWPALLPWSWYLVRDLGPWLDGVALVLPPIVAAGALASVVAALLRRTPPTAAAMGSWVTFGLVVIVLPWAPRSGPAPVPATALRIAAVNVHVVPDPTAILASLARARPDIVVVTEVSDSVDLALARRYRWRVRSGNGEGDVVVFANRPLQALPELPALAAMRHLRVEVEGANGPFVLYSLHLAKPGAEAVNNFQMTLTGQRGAVGAVVRAVEAERLPVVVAGDLNLSDRTTGYRRLTRVLDDGARNRWTGPTSAKPTTRYLYLRIDHILMPESWCSTRSARIALPGSDHRGVVSTVGPCPGR